MSYAFDSGDRFLRPANVAGLRRNQRRIRLGKAAHVVRNALLLAMLVAGGAGAWWQTHSSSQFAVRRVELSGVVHASRNALAAVTSSRVGTNLFRLDIARLERELRSVPWVAQVLVEKKLPGTLHITIRERAPVAIVHYRTPDADYAYVDGEGNPIASLSAEVGDDDLPVITAASPQDLRRAALLISQLRKVAPDALARISEIRPLQPQGFALFDRGSHATLYAGEGDLVQQWGRFDAIAGAEKCAPGSIEYADLRFGPMIIVKPVHGVEQPQRQLARVTQRITN